jgi:hypothetical protein
MPQGNGGEPSLDFAVRPVGASFTRFRTIG